MYHQGARELQDRFASRALADRLDDYRREQFTDEDAAFIAEQSFFFLATADAEGRPDCSFKGGPPGFAWVVSPDLLVFPDYDGNGMFRSLGNVRVNPNIGILFIAVGETPRRLRVNGRAEVVFEDPMMAGMPGAQMLVRVTPASIFPNCPRYIPRLDLAAPSVYVPADGAEPVEPAWKSYEIFKDVVPPRAR
jgi:predicted pyridoxine 5'-phosphate oxidase superfamily flavin-nucleotide-binding protein